MKIGEFLIGLGLDTDLASFAKGDSAIDRIQNGLGTLVIKAKQAVSALIGIGIETAEYADTIDEAAQKTGLDATMLQEMAYAASFSSLELADLTTGLKFLSQSMVEADTKSKGARQTFKKLGVDFEDAHGKLRPVEDVLLDLSDAFQAMPDGAKKTAMAVDLFGKSGTALIPFLNEGGKGIEKLRAEAHRLGIVLDETAIRQGREAADAGTRLGAAWTGLKRTIGAELLPELAKAANKLTEWIVANRKAVGAGMRAFVQALALAFRGLAAAIEWLGRHTTILKAIMIALGVAATAAAIAAVAAWAAAIWPFLAIAAAIAGIIALFANLNEVGQFFADVGEAIKDGVGGAIDWVGDKFMAFVDWFDKQLERLANAARSVKEALFGGASGQAVQMIRDAAQREGVALPPELAGAPAVPSVPASAPGGKGTIVNQINAPLTVNAPPGMGPDQAAEFAKIAAREAANHWDTKVREAAAAGD